MPFAAVVMVKIEGDPALSQKMLEETLVPRIKSRPGFQRARFMRSLDGTTGVGAVTFDTEANARAGIDTMTTDRPPEAPAVQSTAIYEVILEV